MIKLFNQVLVFWLSLSIIDLLLMVKPSSASVLRFEMKPTSALLYNEPSRRRTLGRNLTSTNNAMPEEHPVVTEFHKNRHLSRHERHLRSLLGMDFQVGWSGEYKSYQILNSSRHRNLQQFHNFQSAPLSQGYGTHYVHLWIGSPVPQRQSVIVDTGSRFTAFPCQGCKKCGQRHHTDAYFQPNLSATFRQLKCPSECLENASCDTHDPKKICKFSQSYTEGSSWQASQAADLLYCGGSDILQAASHVDTNYSIPFMFGCLQEVHGLFVTQLADGIMGLSAQESTLPKQLYNLGKIEYNMFALCFRKELGSSKRGVTAGTMTLGGVSSTLDTSPMVYAKNTQLLGWYTVKVKNIYVAKKGGRSFLFDSANSPALNDIVSIPIDIAAVNSGKGVIVDSGTTDTYLNVDIFPAFGKVWKQVTGTDYNHGPLFLTQTQLQALPTVLVQFQSAASSFENYPKPVLGQVGYLDPDSPMDVLLAIPATSYMEYLPTMKLYSSRLYFTETVGGVLGANAMAGHNILFDWHHHRIGFSQSSCAYDLIEKEENDKYDKSETFGDDCKLGSPLLTTPCVNSVDVSICQASDNPTNVEVMGVEVWTRLVLNAGKFSSCHSTMEHWSLRQNIHLEPSQINCTFDGQCQEFRPCKVPCIKAMDHYKNEKLSSLPTKPKLQLQQKQQDSSTASMYCSEDTSWSACDYHCKQTRIISQKNENEVCVELSRSTRDCHIDACGRNDACVVPYLVHAILVIEGNVTDEWDFNTLELFRQEFTRVAHLQEFRDNSHTIFQEGDVNVLTIRGLYEDYYDEWVVEEEEADTNQGLENVENAGIEGIEEAPIGVELILQVSIFNSKATVAPDASFDFHHRSLLQPIEGLWVNATTSVSSKSRPTKEKPSNCIEKDIYPLARDALELANQILEHQGFASKLVENLQGFNSARVVSSWVINTQMHDYKVNYYGPLARWGPWVFGFRLICDFLYKVCLLWVTATFFLFFKDMLLLNFPGIRAFWQCIVIRFCKWWTGRKWPRYGEHEGSPRCHHDPDLELTDFRYSSQTSNAKNATTSPAKRRTNSIVGSDT